MTLQSPPRYNSNIQLLTILALLGISVGNLTVGYTVNRQGYNNSPTNGRAIDNLGETQKEWRHAPLARKTHDPQIN